MDITKLDSKEAIWQEILERTKHNQGDFTEEEVERINSCLGAPPRKAGAKAGVTPKKTVPIRAYWGDVVHTFSSVKECARYFNIASASIRILAERGTVSRQGKLKGWRMERVE